MVEKPYLIRMNIAHYKALLKLDLDERKRTAIEQLLAETEEALALAVAADSTSEMSA